MGDELQANVAVPLPPNVFKLELRKGLRHYAARDQQNIFQILHVYEPPEDGIQITISSNIDRNHNNDCT